MVHELLSESPSSCSSCHLPTSSRTKTRTSIWQPLPPLPPPAPTVKTAAPTRPTTPRPKPHALARPRHRPTPHQLEQINHFAECVSIIYFFARFFLLSSFLLWSLYFSLYFIFRSMDRLHKPFQNTDIILHTDLARFSSTKTHSFFSSSFVYFGFYFLATARFLCASTNSSYKCQCEQFEMIVFSR